MISDRVRRLRQQLEALHESGISLDPDTLAMVLFALVLIHSEILDLEEKMASMTDPSRSNNVIPFPRPHRPN